MIAYKHLESKIGISKFGLVYDCGGATEKEGARGISHIMEHLMCKTFDDLQPKLRELGIDNNACTSDNHVVFWWEGLDDEIAQMKDILIERIMFPKEAGWKEEGFKNEHSTILQEYADCFNDQFQGFYYNSLRKYYNYYGAIGLRADIEKFSYEDSLRCSRAFLIPNTIFEVGHQSASVKSITCIRDPMPNSVTNVKFGNYDTRLESVPKEDKTMVGLISNTAFPKDNHAIISFLCSCITHGLESPLYQEIREKRGLSYYSIGWSQLIGNRAVSFFASSTTNDKADELANVYQDFLTLKPEQAITRERFDTCKAALLLQEKKAKVLPHEGVDSLLLADVNPYDSVRELSYEQAIHFYRDMFNNDRFCAVRY